MQPTQTFERYHEGETVRSHLTGRIGKIIRREEGADWITVRFEPDAALGHYQRVNYCAQEAMRVLEVLP